MYKLVASLLQRKHTRALAARLAIYSPSQLAHLLNRTKPEEWRWLSTTKRGRDRNRERDYLDEKKIRSTFLLDLRGREAEGSDDEAMRGEKRKEVKGKEDIERLSFQIGVSAKQEEMYI